MGSLSVDTSVSTDRIDWSGVSIRRMPKDKTLAFKPLSVLDLPVPRSQTALMQLLQLLVGRERYRYWCGGTVRKDKLAAFAEKMSKRYALTRNARQRSYDRKRGLACVQLLVRPAVGDNVQWWLVSTAGKGGLADPASPDAQVARHADSKAGHVVVDDYVLLYTTKPLVPDNDNPFVPHMPNLRIKADKNRHSAQLVRYRYCKIAKRSVTAYVGTVSADADPDYLYEEVQLKAGEQLGCADYELIRAWLAAHGTCQGPKRRLALREQVAEELRAQVRSQDRTQNPWTRAIDALAALAQAINNAPSNAGESSSELKVQYKAVRVAFEAVQAAGQKQGFVKQRGPKRQVETR